MKFILFYYTAMLETGTQVDGEPAPTELVDFDKLESFAKAAKPKDGETALYLREAERFDGQIETHKDTLPVAVIVLGTGPDVDRVREAYEKVDVEVTDGDVDDPDAVSDAAEASDSDGDRFDGDIGKLKERAHDLGITFSPTIGYDNLLARVQAKEKADEQSGRDAGDSQ